MRVSHGSSALSASFDEPNLVSCAGLAPVLAAAERAGLAELVGQHLTLAGEGGVNAAVKVTSLVAGMLAGADCIDDMDLLRHGAMARLFTGVRAPRRWGSVWGRSRLVRCASSTRSPPACCPFWWGRRRSCPTRATCVTSTSMTRSRPPTAIRSRAPGTATAGSRA